MPEAHYQPGQSFSLQFAWRLPNGDYLRAIFQATVLDLVPGADKYVIRLARFLAGREDEADGRVKPLDELEGEYWDLVRELSGRTITIAYEADDGHPLYLRLATLTGEHNFFTRYEDARVIARGIEARLRRRAQEVTPEEPSDDSA
ncbi:MAG: hypothetical protein KC410_01935 [Anaerolineales bacterium]|uniref:hypothetical protein n=1 Tax=Promineifilum sp. TaxID=2664178 RepID=UPI001D9B84F7|nr:hypothetical protein [Anaerolineales bacterium]MCB8936184.1 hypothetical protein [Promineifilum sp.]MCO5178644.1 hypothetical protein [Promineifilum sp.]